ncbi:class I SAM-dependent methyltransferase [Mycobacterium vicinigordonae]|uniref:Class I SAM-dependent methyltransferase n=1 Tax=Mycobacterium vicinigordonae TaxID=1719132 RepID=A0A7D6HR64_9MYCO|nr:class I SAM-dependent methyltransferase [Mycobacterium vicinigordonae]QLL05372.1 class I SAM-dependent methyltransferase [Mycobacterium vicinigordonae]
MTSYDDTGVTYSQTRRPDPRIAAAINRALGAMKSVANIGAGTGSYESARTVAAVEPSRVMIGQRRAGSAPVVQAVAEALPLRTDAVDVALAILTVHHWTDLAAGVAEMLRVARRRLLILTWDHDIIREFWLLREYFPAAAETDARLAVPIDTLVELLGAQRTSVVTVPVPHDCMDGFGGAYWRRPRAYLDETVRQGMSLFSMTSSRDVREGVSRLRTDLRSGEWRRRHSELLSMPELDLGYRLLIADLS